MPVNHVYYDGTAWVGRGGGNVSPGRDNLVLGAYIPSASTAGLLPGWAPADLTPVYPSGAATYISITSPGPYENKIFWGEVRMQSSITPVFKNCAFAGRDPVGYTTLQGLIKCYGTGYYQFTLEDCLIDGGLWLDPTVVRPGGAAPTDLQTWRRQMAYTAGLHGGRATMRRCEIKNVQDSVNWVQTKIDTSDTSFMLMEGCWVHKNVYYWGEDWTATTDGSHSDSFQTNTGSNLTLRGNMFGGVRDMTGYNTFQGYGSGTPSSYNSGDDAWNAGLMLKQEVDNGDLRRIENVLIEKNFYQSGEFCINHAYTSTRPNMFTTTQIKDNYFIRRTDSHYIIRHSNFASCYSNNRVVDLDGNGGFTVAELAPINNG